MALVPADNWAYRKQIDINDAGAVSANYQMKLIIYRGVGADNTATGEIYCDNNTDDWVDDIRFGTTNDATTAIQLDQWIEVSDAVVATIWVEFPASGANTIYLFIGRVATANFSDGDATFHFFDHFPGVAIDGAKWDTLQGSIGVNASNAEVTGTAGVRGLIELNAAFAFGVNYQVRASARWSDIQQGGQRWCYCREHNNWNERIGFDGMATNNIYRCRSFTGGAFEDNINRVVPLPTNYNQWIFQRNNGATNIFLRDDAPVVTHGVRITNANLELVMYESNIAVGTVYVDWVFVAKYAVATPTYNTFGAWIYLVADKKYRGWQSNEQELTRD